MTFFFVFGKPIWGYKLEAGRGFFRLSFLWFGFHWVNRDLEEWMADVLRLVNEAETKLSKDQGEGK